MNTKHITAIFAVLMLTVLCASAYVSVPTITDGIGFQYLNVTVGDNNQIRINDTTVTKEAVVVIAGSDSPNKEAADYICTGMDDQDTFHTAMNEMVNHLDVFDTINVSCPPLPMSWGSAWFDGSQYHAFMPAGGNVNHYTSPDGEPTTWTADTANNPVLSGGAEGTWDAVIDVVKAWYEDGSGWFMLYRGRTPADTRKIGLATSPDGVAWTKEATNPVMVSEYDWEVDAIDPTGIIKIDTTYYMWYNNVGGISRKSGIATSDDLITWVKDAKNPIFTGQRFCSDIFKQGDYYYIITPHYSGTHGGFEELELWRSKTVQFYGDDRDFMGVIAHGDRTDYTSYGIDVASIITTTIQRDVLPNDILKVFYTYAYGGGSNWKMSSGLASGIPTNPSPMGGDYVMLPGTYKFTNYGITRENVHIHAKGAIIESHIADVSEACCIMPEHLTKITGLKIVNRIGTADNVIGVYPLESNSITLNDVEIAGFKYGVYPRYDTIIQDCFIHDCHYGVYFSKDRSKILGGHIANCDVGVHVLAGGDYNVVERCLIENAATYGVQTSGDHTKLYKNIFLDISGHGIQLYDCDRVTISRNAFVNPATSKYAMNLQLGTRMTIDHNEIAAGSSLGSVKMLGCSDSDVTSNKFMPSPGLNYAKLVLTNSGTTPCTGNMIHDNDVETGRDYGITEHHADSDNNRIFENRIVGATTAGVRIQGADSIAYRNAGFVTENSGTDTLASGTTSIAVTHGLDATPAAGDIMVTAMESLGSASFFWIDTYTSTTFNVTVNADPTQDVDFAWLAAVY